MSASILDSLQDMLLKDPRTTRGLEVVRVRKTNIPGPTRSSQVLAAPGSCVERSVTTVERQQSQKRAKVSPKVRAKCTSWGNICCLDAWYRTYRLMLRPNFDPVKRTLHAGYRLAQIAFRSQVVVVDLLHSPGKFIR